MVTGSKRGAVMRRAISIVGLVLVTLLACPPPARADFWDWLQEFSGPGPFHARLPNLMFDICPQQTEVATTDRAGNQTTKTVRGLRDFQDPVQSADDRANGIKRVPKCVFADFRFFQNRDDDNFGVPGVKLDTYEFGASVRLHPAISLGFGGGAMRVSNGDHTAWQGVLTAPRVVLKPLLIYGSSDFWRRNEKLHLILSTVKYYVKEDIVLGHLTGVDFGAPPNSPNAKFDVQNDRVFSTGFIVDLTDVVIAAFQR
jgi:hypothetical protein